VTKEIHGIEDLQPDAHNANQHSERGRYMVEQSIRTTGAGRSIVADANGIVLAGNLTLEVAEALDLPVKVVQTQGDTLVVVQRTDLDLSNDEGDRARRHAWHDNRDAEVSINLDVEIFAADLEAGIDLSDMFHDDEKNAMLEEAADELLEEDTLEPEKDIKAEQLAELVGKWGVELGQLWQIDGKANHRVICGDSGEPLPEDWPDKGGASLIYDPDWDSSPEFDATGYDSVLAFGDGKRARGVIELFGAPTWVFTWDLVTSRCTGQRRPLKRGKLCLWYGDVDEFDLDGAHYGEPGEPGIVTSQWGTYEYKPDPRGKHLSDVFQLSLPRFHAKTLHHYEKPLDWMRLLIGDCLPKARIVVDPFLGSGAAMVACEQLGRPCYGVDISPEYVAYTLERMSNLGCKCRTGTRSISATVI